MRITVVQHRLRPTPAEDAAALCAAARDAVTAGADLVVLPALPGRIHGEVSTQVNVALCAEGVAFVQADPARWPAESAAVAGAEELGRVALLAGDACFDPAAWSTTLAQGSVATVLSPFSENDLQAEAALEVALALSDALTGLVIIAECSGGELGEAGHGGSAIILLGDVVAEAMADDDSLVAEVALPVPQPEPREAFPVVPTLIAQRLAHHDGRKLDMGYLADLTDGQTGR